MKTCIQCKDSKELEEFPVRLESKDLHRNTCKVCVLANNRERKQRKILAYNAALKEKVCSNKRCKHRGVMQPLSNFKKRDGCIAYRKRCNDCQDIKYKTSQSFDYSMKAWPIPRGIL